MIIFRRNLYMLPTDDIKAAALRAYPNEMCGFVLTDGSFVEIVNVAANPRNAFKMGAVDVARWIKRAAYLVHTHIPTAPRSIDIRMPSRSDVDNQRKLNIPWLIYGCDGESITAPLEFPQRLKRPEMHRPFIPWVQDCFSLVRDYYHSELGVFIPEASYDDAIALIRCELRILDVCQTYGFKPVYLSDTRPHDLLLVNHAGLQANHLLILVDDAHVIHQSELLQKEPLTNFIGRIVTGLRHESIC